MYSLIFLTAKSEEIQKKIVTFVWIKNRFAHFWKIKKNIEKNLISNFLFGDCSLMYCIRNVFAIFFKKKVPVFFENENFVARVWPILPIF